MKTIITVQHTQSVHHNNKMVGSWTDWELSEPGRRQAENIGRRLAHELADRDWKIYSSDLARAMQTAEPLARRLGTEIIKMPDLREHNLGEAVGKSAEWARANEQPVKTFDDRQFPGAESWREFWNRVSRAMDAILTDEAENIVLFSHGMTLSVWQQIWRGDTIRPFEYLGHPGGVSFFRVGDDGTRETLIINDLKYMTD
jgi:broad specificity phosphatase PhoE